MMQKIIAIVGPTATGKSALAVTLSKKFNGEVVSVDSRQVYKGLNLGTGKITRREMRNVPHHLLDVVLAKKQFSAGEYKRLADLAIQSIVSRGKLPVLCGGTGFYLETILSGQALPDVPPNILLRKKLTSIKTPELFKMLKKIDPARAKNIDSNNPRRLVRAIEIAEALGKVPKRKNVRPPYNALVIGLRLPPSTLKEKIHIRLLARIKHGLIEESKKLYKNGLSYKRMEELGLEYKYLSKYLTGEITREEMVSYLEKAIWQYSKRQITWFKRDKKIIWLDVSKKTFLPKVKTLVKKFLGRG